MGLLITQFALSRAASSLTLQVKWYQCTNQESVEVLKFLCCLSPLLRCHLLNWCSVVKAELTFFFFFCGQPSGSLAELPLRQIVDVISVWHQSDRHTRRRFIIDRQFCGTSLKHASKHTTYWLTYFDKQIEVVMSCWESFAKFSALYLFFQPLKGLNWKTLTFVLSAFKRLSFVCFGR